MNITKDYIINFLQADLISKLAGTYLNSRKIIDVKVLIEDQDYHDDDGGFSYTSFEIKVLLESPGGRRTKWVNYYL